VAAAATDATGVYVYGVTLADVECAADTVDEGALRAVVSIEPLAGYAPEAVEAALREEPDWLEQRLRAHEAVLEQVLAAGPVAPFRFGTIFRSEDELRGALARAQESLSARLRQLRGTAEWGVKAWADDGDLRRWVERHDAHAARERADLDAAPEGRRYLLEKRLRRRLDADATELAFVRAQEAHAVLSAVAEESSVERPSGLDEQPGKRLVLRAAYLVADDRLSELERALAEVRGRGAELGVDYVLSGPWPAYSFVDPGLA
jgi:hypothetical protein